MADMTPDEQTSEIARIKERITDLIESHFNRGESILYLSKLGIELGDDRPRLEKLTQRKLGQFLKDDPGEFEVGVTGQHKNILYLMPKGQSLDSIPPPSPRYARRFWAAFARPLPTEETQRFINISTFFFGPDAEQLKQEGASDIRPIDAEYISAESGSGGVVGIADRIKKWLKAQGLDERAFLAENDSATTKERSLLISIISALDAGQLSRVSLPLDVVKTLLERRS